MKVPSVASLINAVCFLALLPVPGHALTPAQVFDKVKDAVVVVKTLDAQGQVKGQGSGVLLPSGRVATNCHVIEDGSSYRVGRGNQLVFATLYATNFDKDICILTVNDITGKSAQLGTAASLKVGDPVYAVGAPEGFELSLSDGIVAQLRGRPSPLIQTTAAISHGSSGGGLFDGEGRLVGLTFVSVEGGQSLNFAIPVEWIGEEGRKPAIGGHSHAEWLEGSIALEKTKDWQGRLEWDQKWTESEPEDADAWEDLGLTYELLDRDNDAIEAYGQAIRTDPKDTDAWFDLGELYHLRKRYNDAIKAYREAVRIDPDYYMAWTNLGLAYDKLKRYNDAIKAYRQAVRIRPKDAYDWYSLGCAYGNLKRYNEAIAALRQAVRIDPKDWLYWHDLALVYGHSGNKTAALEAGREERRLHPALVIKPDDE